MSKKNLKLQDLSFYGDKTSSKYHDSEFINWDRSGGKGSPIFFTDLCLSLATLPTYKGCYKIAWLLEPMVINQAPYQFIAHNHNLFDMVLTHHEDVLPFLDEKGILYPNGMSWIAKDDWKKYDKPKNISIVASNKNYAPGHKMRHDLIKRLPKVMDTYGNAYQPIEHKIEALRDYKYSVAIENCSANSYFTEKLLDCFLTYTVPIYWGCPKIGEFFDTNGMLVARDLKELASLVMRVHKEPDRMYSSELTQQALQKNFEKAKQYVVAEDWIYQNILVPKKLI